MKKFSDLNLSERLLGILSDIGYETPTPIQKLSIPPIIAGHDVLGIAKTGSGKTAAFSLPIIEKQIRNPDRKCATLVFEPTRELAQQTARMISEYTKFFPIKVYTVFGNDAELPTSSEVRQNSHFIVATPGAMLGLVKQDQKLVGDINHLIFDEADKLLQLNFLETINKVLYFMPERRQTIFYTSTFNIPIERMAKNYLRIDYKKLTAETGKNKFSKPSETISQLLQYVDKEKKFALLSDLLNQFKPESAIVFLRTQARAEKVFKKLIEKKINASLIHGGKEQRIRDKAYQNFSENKTNILITTDLAARGLDFDNISHVINFDLPATEDTYVHRIGRTGRAGKTGTAISFAEPLERVRMESIQKMIRARIPLLQLDNWDNTVPPIQKIAPNKDKALKLQKQKRLNRKQAKMSHRKPNVDKKQNHTFEQYIEYKKAKKAEKREKKVIEKAKKNNT